MYQAYEKGVMPFGGDLMNQPVKVIEIFDLVEAYKNDKIKRDNMKASHQSSMQGMKRWPKRSR
jgi:hypothetical protein